jgi:hypothetical protein
MCQLLPLPGPDWKPILVLLFGITLLFWPIVFERRLLGDLLHGGVELRYLSLLSVSLLAWIIFFVGVAWNYALYEWKGTNLDRLLAHKCGTQQLLATYTTASNLMYIPVIGGLVIVAMSSFLVEWPRLRLELAALGDLLRRSLW